MEQRKSNLELLRIVSILMIIVFHCAYKSGFDFPPGFSVNKLIVKSFWMLGELGVNLFMLITGYFMGRFKWKKLVRLLAEAQFYRWFILFAGIPLGLWGLPSGKKKVFLNFFPVLQNDWWFLTAYVLVYLFSPYLNTLIRAMDEKTYRKFLLTALGAFCVIPTFFGFFSGDTEAMLYYNRFIWLIIMYFLGAYICVYMQNHENQNFFTKINALRLSAASAAVLVLSILVIDRFSGFFERLGTTEPAYFWQPNSIPLAALSAGLFVLFLRTEIPYSPVINAAASTTLGIYLLHDGWLQWWLWRVVFRCAEYQDSPGLAVRVLGAALVIFLAGMAVDLLRQRLEKYTLVPLLDAAGRRLAGLGGGGRNGGVLMKKLKKALGERCGRPVLRSRGVRFFCVFFLLYVFLGLCLFNYGGYDTNMFFGADNARVFDDLVNIEGIYRHYRIVLHPLFLLLGQTVTLLADGAVNRPVMSALLTEACCGALSVSLFDAVLGRRKADGRVRTLFTLIYGFSFSALIFSTVPETFIFGALGLVSYWYFLSAAAGAEGPLSGREIFLLVFFGAVNCGTTITNYAFYLAGLLYLLLCRYSRGAAAKAFCLLNVLNGAAIAAACLYQRFVWREAPLFWEYIVHWADPSEEGRFMDTGASTAKIKEWLAQTVCDPLLSPDMYLKNPDRKYHPIQFLEQTAPLKIVLLLFWVLLAACLLAWLAGLRKRRFEAERDGFVLALLAAYGGGLALHYIYGYDEAFMYSPHYLFFILLAAPLALERSGAPALKRVLVPGLAAFLAAEAVNNLYRYAQTTRLALSTTGSDLCLPHAVKGAALCGALLLAALLGWERLAGNRPAAPESGEDPAVRRLCAAVQAYCVLILVVSLFIAFNY